MPTIVRQNGFRVMIHTDDHAPPHVHCYRANRLVVINLDDLSVRDREHADERDVRTALRIVQQHLERLHEAWREFHGEGEFGANR